MCCCTQGASKMANQREQSLEQCQKLILQWAKELKTVDIDTVGLSDDKQTDLFRDVETRLYFLLCEGNDTVFC